MKLYPGDSVAMDPDASAVVPRRQEVTFADGSALWLHCVTDDTGRADPFARRIPLADGEWARVDLRQLSPDLTFHLPGASARDVSTAIFHSLRKRFDSALAMRQSMGGLAA